MPVSLGGDSREANIIAIRCFRRDSLRSATLANSLSDKGLLPISPLALGLVADCTYRNQVACTSDAYFLFSILIAVIRLF